MSLFRRHPQPDELTDTDDHDAAIDPDLRLRTVRTAASTIAESIRSEQRAERRLTMRKKRARFFRRDGAKKRPKTAESAVSEATTAAPHIPGKRRNVYVNSPLSPSELDQHGEPLARYARNKVRTSRYTLLTFLPKNLFEQFHRIANIYFLALVIFQLFPIFGAASASTAALPILFILTVTAIKDGVEDYRRAQVDEEVNTSAVTKLGEWRNVNIVSDPRPWFQRLLRINPPGKVSKGVRKLREKETSKGVRIMLSKTGDQSSVSMSMTDFNESVPSLSRRNGAGGRRLEDIQSVDSHTYPPALHPADEAGGWSQENPSLSRYQQSITSRSSLGVVDWSRRITGTARWERTLWKKLEVGDVVLLRENEQVPADVVVLSTSDPDGLCYLETKNLDGETNLKARKALRATSSLSSEEDIEKASFVLDSEPPHQNLYVYNAVLRYTDAATGEPRREGVTINELLLRGCTVRNTSWIIGLVVFTGPDTKIYLNGGLTPSKQSKISKETNFNVIVNFIFLVIICTLSAIISGIMDGLQDTSTRIYEQGVDPTNSTVLNALVTFVSCLIAFQNIVPVSLFISIEIVKTIQAYFIAQDRGAAKREGREAIDPEELSHKLAALKDDMVNRLVRLFKNRYAQVDRLTLISPKLAEDIADRSSEQASHIVAFFRALAVCHTVLADKPEPTEKPHFLQYKAESPDEAALVGAARDVGFPGQVADGDRDWCIIFHYQEFLFLVANCSCIGFSCNLLKQDMEIMILSSDSPEGTRAQIEAGLNKIASILGPPSWDPKKRGFVPGAQAAFAVVIDGETLRHALLPDIKPLFLNLGTQCETVVCCRVSPAQKALTVKLVGHLHVV
ncbi:hypothetical protein ID866_9153, partial [Astraeus odoratus]